jgi:SSS family solute:Na+ symporter
LNLYTAYEYLERRFNLTVRIIVSITFHILRCVHLVLVVYAPSLVINLVTGMPIWQCIVCVGIFTTAYTALGGIQAVIWTDVIQFTAVISGVAVVYWKALGHINGGLNAVQIAADGGRLRLFNFSTPATELTSIWATVIGGAVLCMAPMTTDRPCCSGY